MLGGVAAPNGEMVPAKIVQQPDGDFKVEYSSKFTGRHTVEILYAQQAIMGSPFYVEIYDPNKIKVLGAPNSHVGQRVEFESECLARGPIWCLSYTRLLVMYISTCTCTKMLMYMYMYLIYISVDRYAVRIFSCLPDSIHVKSCRVAYRKRLCDVKR